MFTGIIETTGTIKEISENGTNKTFWIDTPLADQLKIDQSVAHNGVCLTVEAIDDNVFKVTAVAETLSKTNLDDWKTGHIINLERCLQLSGRLDGHFVQGHTDTRGLVLKKTDLNGSWQFTIEFDAAFASLIIEKGSIAVNGISLTVFDVKSNTFSVAIIPYTYLHTNLRFVQPGHTVNIEFDMLGKYLIKWAEVNRKNNLL
jgi:riboflavin synthase